MSDRLRKLIPVIVSLVAAGIFGFRAIPFLLDGETACRWDTIGWIILLVIGVQLVNAVKSQALLGWTEDWGRIIGVCLVGNFFGAFFFTQLAGDVSRVWMLNGDRRSSGRYELAVLRDRVSGLFAVGFLVLSVLFLFMGIGAGFWISLLMGWIILSMGSPLLERLFGGLANGILRLRVFRGLKLFQKLRSLQGQGWGESPNWFLVHFLSLLVQFAGVLAVYLSFSMIGSPLSLSQSTILTCVAALAVVLPLTLGGIGVREISQYSLLLGWGIGESHVAVGVAQLTIGFLLGTAIGAVGGKLLLERCKRAFLQHPAPLNYASGRAERSLVSED